MDESISAHLFTHAAARPNRVLTDLRLEQGIETTRTEIIEMLLWEDTQATPAFAKRVLRFRQAHPAVRRRV